jgi:exodeoxyribonuclease III
MVHDELKLNKEWFVQGSVVVAGDFNSSPRLDQKGAIPNHESIVSLLGEHGLESAYHMRHEPKHGDEKQYTFYMGHKEEKPHHIDYFLVPCGWADRVADIEVLPYKTWGNRSDHCPLVLDLNDVART